MRIHITGMSPRMVSQRAREKITFARLLEAALVEMGHQVYRHPMVSQDADLMIIGVASPLAPGATYALSGLATLGAALQDEQPVLLFVDDPNLQNIQYSASSARNMPERLYTDYLMSKRVKATTTVSLAQRSLIRQAVWQLAERQWPEVLLPLHPWARPELAARWLNVDTEVCPLDVSPLLDISVSGRQGPRPPLWFSDRHYSRHQLAQERVSWQVVPIDSRGMDSPVTAYAAAAGVHQGAMLFHGWWTPTPQYVAAAGSVYLCDGDENELIGVASPYYITPDYVESLTEVQQRRLAWSQHDYLQEVMWTRETLFSQLADAIGRTSN